jgi:hypothetical protein
MKTPTTMLISLLLALNALACTESDDPRIIGGEGTVLNSAMPFDCTEIGVGVSTEHLRRKRPTAADVREYVRLVADEQRRGISGSPKDPPPRVSDYVVTSVYQRVKLNDPNTLRFVGWQIADVGTVKYLHDPKGFKECFIDGKDPDPAKK